jgi:hypothetical protein
MAVERTIVFSSLAEVVDYILYNGSVIDTWVRLSLAGTEPLDIEVRADVGRVDTYLKYAEKAGARVAATYLYAIIPTGEQMIFDVAGVCEDCDEGSPLRAQTQRVYTIPHRDLAAVVGASPLADYGDLKRDEAVRYLVAHQRVVEAVMQDFPILPAKFGTVLPDEAWVRRLLAQGEALFRTTLQKFSAVVQIEVVILWNLQEIFQEIGQEKHIAQLKAQVAGHPPDETIIERVAIGQMVQASLEQRRASLRDYLIHWLREVALDLVVYPPPDDSMVANVALLMDEAGQEALGRRLELLDEEFKGRLTFRCMGPLPPYSFATVEVEVPCFEVVDEARRRLGLGETATPGEIKRAYHRLTDQRQAHHNPDDPEAEPHLAELAQAYEFLTVYAEAVQGSKGAREQGSRGEGERQSEIPFSREVVEQTLLIAIRRQEMPA